MRKFFKNKVLYILSATAIIFSCLFMFLFKGPKVEAADLKRDTLNHDAIYNNTNTSTGKGSYGNWSWTGITEFNYDGDGYGDYYYLYKGKSITITYNIPTSLKGKIKNYWAQYRWGGPTEIAPGVSYTGVQGGWETDGYFSYCENDEPFTKITATDKITFTMTVADPSASSYNTIAFSWFYVEYESEVAVTIDKGTGVKSVYLSTTNNATSGSASGAKFDSGATVYGFAELAKGYKAQNNWTLVSGTANTEGAKYRVGSVSAGSQNFGTVNAAIQTFNITYDLNYGTVSGTNPTSYNVNTNTFTLINPTRTGFTFKGWSGTNLEGDKNTTVTITKGTIGDKSYVANWTVNTYNVKIDGMDDIEIEYGTRIDISNRQMPSISGYTFVGFYGPDNLDYIDADGKGTRAWSYAEDDILLHAKFTKDMSVTATGFSGSYDGEEHTISVIAVDPDDSSIGGFEIKYGETEGTYPNTTLNYVNSGTYTIYFEVTNATYYRKDGETVFSGYTTYRGSGTVEITPMPVTADAYETLPKGVDNLVYNNTDVDLITAGALKTDNDYGDILYRVVAEDGSVNTEYSTTLPKGHNATTYTIYYKTSGKGNYGAIPEASFTVTIAEVDKTELSAKIDDVNNYLGTINDDYADIASDLEGIKQNIINNYYNEANVTTTDVSNAITTLDNALNNAKANVTKAKIDAIGEVAYTSDCKALIDDARAYFDNLDNQAQKDLVTNLAVLEAAEELYNAVDEVVNEIKNIGTAEDTNSYREKVEAARTSYNNLTIAAKEIFPEDILNLLVDREKAIEVMDKINSIGKVEYTPESKGLIDTARAAYELLSANQKALVVNYNTLLAAEKLYDAMNKINSIGEVEYTPESKELIDTARAAYDALDENLKALVSNYETLTDAEAKYKDLDDCSKADAVAELIDNIGNVQYNETSKNKIDTARAAYEALTSDQKVLVDNLNKLTSAETTYNNVDRVYKEIENINEVKYGKKSKEEIESARESYEALTEEEKGILPNYEKLEAAKAKYNVLEYEHKVFVGWMITLAIIGGIVLTLCIIYLLLFFVLNKWTMIDGKPARVFKIGKKDGKIRLLKTTCVVITRSEEEVFKSKKDIK